MAAALTVVAMAPRVDLHGYPPSLRIRAFTGRARNPRWPVSIRAVKVHVGMVRHPWLYALINPGKQFGILLAVSPHDTP